MFLRQTHYKKTGRTNLAIVQGYRDNQGKAKSKVKLKIGYLDEMQKIYDDPIAHFEALATQMTEEQKASNSITITLDMNEQLSADETYRKNYGYIIYSKIYHELEINRFLNNARRHEPFKFNSEAIMRLLVYSRLLNPGSKRAAHINKDIFFDNFDFSLDDVYDSLDHFDEISVPLQQHLHNQVTEQYGRTTDLIYYDVTNYYFEIDKQDELRRKGAEKNGRRDPIVQMGLLLDTLGLPISYKMFPGNTHDSQTLMPTLTNIKKQFNANRIITVADKGLHSGDNIAYCTALGDGYIFSKSVRGASQDFKEWVLDEVGYVKYGSKYKIKSKMVPNAKIKITIEQISKKKKKKEMEVEQKWIAFYSEKYAIRAKLKREEAIAKALKLIKNPSKYQRTFDYGAVGYIENIKIDKETGIIENVKATLKLNYAKIKEEEKYDGYYAIVTSEMDAPDEHIVEMYHGLWRIEESFKISKSILGTRPFFVRTEPHINAHFLICFLSLLIARCVELRLGGEYTVENITEELDKVACSNIQQNLWLCDYKSELTDKMNEVFGTTFGKKYQTLKDIKKSLAATKKKK